MQLLILHHLIGRFMLVYEERNFIHVTLGTDILEIVIEYIVDYLLSRDEDEVIAEVIHKGWDPFTVRSRVDKSVMSAIL